MHRFTIGLDDEGMFALADDVVLPVDPGSQGQSLDLARAPLLTLVRQLRRVIPDSEFLPVLDSEQYVANTSRKVCLPPPCAASVSRIS